MPTVKKVYSKYIERMASVFKSTIGSRLLSPSLLKAFYFYSSLIWHGEITKYIYIEFVVCQRSPREVLSILNKDHSLYDENDSFPQLSDDQHLTCRLGKHVVLLRARTVTNTKLTLAAVKEKYLLSFLARGQNLTNFKISCIRDIFKGLHFCFLRCRSQKRNRLFNLHVL